MFQLHESQATRNMIEANAQTVRPNQIVRWISPSPNFIKLNVDGASSSRHLKVAYGGAFWDQNGRYMLGFASSLSFIQP